MAQDLIARIRQITDKPIKYVVLSYYHAVRVLGASAYFAEGAQQVIASRGTYEMIVERGEADMKSEIERFPRLFAGVGTVPGLTWPTLVFEKEITLFLGKLEVRIAHLGAGQHQGRHRGLAAAAEGAVLGRSGRVRRGLLLRRRAARPMAGHARRAGRAGAAEAGAGPRPRADHARRRGQGIAYTKDFVTTLLQAGRKPWRSAWT